MIVPSSFGIDERHIGTRIGSIQLVAEIFRSGRAHQHDLVGATTEVRNDGKNFVWRAGFHSSI